MEVEFDPAKKRRNLAQHQLSLALAIDVLATRVSEIEDIRRDYGEQRVVAFGYLGARPHCVVYTMYGEAFRVISLRKANWKEVRRWHHGEA